MIIEGGMSGRTVDTLRRDSTEGPGPILKALIELSELLRVGNSAV